MCGILAVVADPAIGNRIPDAIFGEALDVLAHRGPDDRGVWSDDWARLGHRRLSIIDLTQKGHQPMADPSTGVVLTFGGEIYNYVELRDDLQALGHTFTSHSDTEVLLRGYIEWGIEVLTRLNGMWHFLVWDPRVRRAFFARDRLGVKPLTYATRDRQVVLASEPKALRVIWPQLRAVDDVALYRFLARGELYAGDRSFYRGVRVLPPAHYGTFCSGDAEPSITRYWSPPTGRDLRDDGTLADKFTELLADSVRLRMRSDVPVGVTLSGGLDSTAILNEAARTPGLQQGALRAFTSVYAAEPNDSSAGELPWARVAVAPHPTVRLDAVPVDVKDWVATLQRIVWHMDGPGSSPAVYPLWSIMRQARIESIPVLLEGQGADELLGGYAEYAALDLIRLARGVVRRPTARAFRGLAAVSASYRKTFSTAALAAWIVRTALPATTEPYRRWVGTAGTLRPEFLAVGRSVGRPGVRPSRLAPRLVDDLTRSVLPGLLQYGDAVSMAHSIESRLPFLDYRLVEFAVRLPLEWKLAEGQTKRVLREHLRRTGQPVIAARRDKQGYPTPAFAWLRQDDGRIAREILLDPGARIWRYCEPTRLRRLIDLHGRGMKGAGLHLYRLVSTELWLRECT
jgi:asparagine synthase (glutamine-hydrolysing)